MQDEKRNMSPTGNPQKPAVSGSIYKDIAYANQSRIKNWTSIFPLTGLDRTL